MASHKSFQSLLVAALFFFPICNSIDTITPIQSLRDGETLISAGEKFVLGFFSPGNSSTNRYVGIWYNKIPDQTIVWTANRENPVMNSSGVLIIKGGNLVLVDEGHGNNSILWSTNVSTAANYSSATLTDSGNLVLTDDHQRVLWESFDYPTNTLLPRLKLGLDRRTGLNRFLTSWKSTTDAAPGEFSFGLDPGGMPQYILRKGSDPIWRSEPWNRPRLRDVQGRRRGFVFTYVANEDEMYYMYYSNDSSIIVRSLLDVSGVLRRLTWNNETRQWNLMWTAVADRCDRYGNCGAYGSCDSNSGFECACLRGFQPKRPGDWNLGYWSDGCMRSKPLDCGGKTDGFLKLARVKLPDTSRSWVEPSWSLKACEVECLSNCSCTAYASADVSGDGRGCLIWYGNLSDLKVYSNEGQELYIRVAASELDKNSDGHSGGFQGKKKLLVTILTVIPVALLFLLCAYCRWKKAKGCKMKGRHGVVFDDNEIEESSQGSELPPFSFSVIAAVTNNFSESNLVGKGGFGPVYKGQLPNGQEIAVKRLSKNSGQGIEEFKNEVALIAKLQHKNLVRLLGCCFSGEEKILIYEYMRNKSLDSLIFGIVLTLGLLDFRSNKEHNIGMEKTFQHHCWHSSRDLHEDSSRRIIHRDLKVSNILLDDYMNPKISDFGMARIFGGNQTQANTNRVVGTYGYMSPEYAMDGLFSMKSDVFSFGVILLEIISGKRNKYYSDHRSMNLIGHVWELWIEDRISELLDSSIGISASKSEVLKRIQVGLLCVQEKPKDRPGMSSVIFMLSKETMMPAPKQPAFCVWKENYSDHPHSSTIGASGCSRNEVSITEIQAR